MSDIPVGPQRIDSSKRTWLIASGCAGAVGGVATAIPFVSTFQPSERAKAAGAPVEVDIGGLQVGEKLTVEWRGKPVWILKRSPDQVAELPKLDPLLADPQSKRNPDEFTPKYAQNENRSIKPEVLVVVGICTHLGCSPTDKLQAGPQASLPDDWQAHPIVPDTLVPPCAVVVPGSPYLEHRDTDTYATATVTYELWLITGQATNALSIGAIDDLIETQADALTKTGFTVERVAEPFTYAPDQVGGQFLATTLTVSDSITLN